MAHAKRHPAPTLRTCGVMPAKGATCRHELEPARPPMQDAPAAAVSVAGVSRAYRERRGDQDSASARGRIAARRHWRAAGGGRPERLRQDDAAGADLRAAGARRRLDPVRTGGADAPARPAAAVAERARQRRARAAHRAACSRAQARARAAPAFRRARPGAASSRRARTSSRAGCASAWRSCARCSRASQLLCLDEPFGALDAITRAEMQAWLAEALAARAAHGRAGDPRRRGGDRARRPRGGALAPARARRSRSSRSSSRARARAPTRRWSRCASGRSTRWGGGAQ